MEKFLNYESSFYALVINKMESQAINHPACPLVPSQPPKVLNTMHLAPM